MKIFKWDEINGQDQDVKMEAFLTAINDTYAILQLKDEEETRPMHFISYAALQKSGDTPDIDHYEVVYVAPLLPYKDQNTLLDETRIRTHCWMRSMRNSISRIRQTSVGTAFRSATS